MMRWRMATVVVAALLGSSAPAFAQCPSTITSARVDPLPLYGADLATPVGQLGGKSAENSLALRIEQCTDEFYFVQAPSVGPAAIRRRQVRTDAQLEIPICDQNAPIAPSGSVNRSGHGATDGNLCRRQ